MRNDANEYDIRTYLTGGLSDKVAMDFAGLFRKNDGYIKDLVRGGMLGDQRVFDIRSKLLFEPNDRMRFVLTAEYFDQNSTTSSYQPIDGNTAGRAYSDVILPTGPWEASLTDRPALDLHRWNVALRTHVEFDAFNLETTTGYMNVRWYQKADSDSTNIFLGDFPAYIRSESISQEVKLLNAQPGRFQWLVGGYFFQFGGESDVYLVSTRPGAPVTTQVLLPHLEGRSFAGFAEGTYEVVDKLFLTAGGRFTTEKRNFRQVANGRDLFGTVDRTFNKWNYRAALRYQFTPQANIYASYGTGFKSGVYNMSGTSPNPVNPETIKAAEAGIKADLLPWMRTNLSAFHYNYDDLQVQAKDAIGPGYVLQNAATAKIYGGEFELTIAPDRDLSLRGSVAYSHARYSSFPNAQSFFPLPQGGNQVLSADATDNVMIRAPKFTFNIGGDWGHDFDFGRISVSANVFHSTKVYYDFQNLFAQPAYTMTNGSISWTTKDTLWRFTLWATNLTNEKVFQAIRVGVLATDGVYEPPRKIGVGVERKF
jgi:iron complex outermembrane receptor protein